MNKSEKATLSVQRLLQKSGEEKEEDEENRVQGKRLVCEEALGLFHDFVFFHRFPEEQEKIEEEKR